MSDMKLVAGGYEIPVEKAYGIDINYNGMPRPALYINVGNVPIRTDALEGVLTAESIVVQDNEGNEIGEYAGYNTVAASTMTLVKTAVDSQAVLQAEAAAERARAEAASARAETTSLRDRFIEQIATANTRIESLASRVETLRSIDAWSDISLNEDVPLGTMVRYFGNIYTATQNHKKSLLRLPTNTEYWQITEID